MEEFVDVFSAPEGVLLQDRPSFVEAGVVVDPNKFNMVPYVPSLVPFDMLNRACVLSDILWVEVCRNG